MTSTAPRTTATGRLGNGELRRQVAAWLDETPDPTPPAPSPRRWAAAPAPSATP